MLAALLSPSSSTNNTSTNSRISQVLPTVKCSTCNQPVPLAELGDHKCEGPPPLPSPNPLSPLSPKGLPVPILRKPPITPEAATKLLPGRLQGRVVGFNANSGSTDTSSSSNPSSNLNSNSRLRIDVDTARPSGSSISPLQSRSSPLSRGLDSGQSLNGGRNNIANGIGQRTHQRPPLGSSVSVSSSMSSSSSSGNGSIFSGISGSSSNTSISSSSTSPLRARGPGLPSSVSPTHKTSASASMAFGSDRIRTRALSNAGSVASSNSAVSSQLPIPRYGVGSRDREVTGNERDGDYSVSRPQFVPPAERGIDTKFGGAAGMAGVGRRGFKAAVDASSTSGYEERERPMGPQPARRGLPAPPGDLTVTVASTAPSRYLDTDAMSVSTSRSTASKSNVPAPSFSGGSVSGSAYSPSKSIPIIPAPSSTSDSYNSANKDTMPPVGLPSSPRVVKGGGGGRSITQAQGAALRDRDRSLGASERNRDLEGEREWERDRERDLRDRGREREPQQRLPVSPIESESEYGGLAYADSTDYEDDEALPPPPPPKASDNVRGAVPPSSATTSVAKKAGYNAQFGSMSLRSRSNDRPGESYGGISGSVSGSALDRVSDREKERSMTKRSQSQAPGRGGQGKRGHTRDESASSAYSSDEDDGRRGGGYRYGSSAGVKDGKARDRDRGSDKDFGDERDRRGRDVGQKAIDAPAKKSSTKKPKKCLKCAKAIEDGKWVPVDSGGVLCDKCWKAMYLPKCRRCNLPIETQAVSSSDGQLKGKYHKECFNCHTCHEPFPDRSFYVFDGRPYCAYHYHEANDSLCASSRCGQPIEGPCAVSHTGDRYHPEHMTCQYVRPREMGGGRCKARLDAEYWEVEGKMLCERHAMVAYGIAGSVSSGRENGGRRGGGSDDGWKEEEERRERERERKKKEMKNMKRVTRFIDLKGGSGLR